MISSRRELGQRWILHALGYRTIHGLGARKFPSDGVGPQPEKMWNRYNPIKESDLVNAVSKLNNTYCSNRHGINTCLFCSNS